MGTDEAEREFGPFSTTTASCRRRPSLFARNKYGPDRASGSDTEQTPALEGVT